MATIWIFIALLGGIVIGAAGGYLASRVKSSSVVAALEERIRSMAEYHERDSEARRREFDEHLKAVENSLKSSAHEMLADRVRSLGEENSRSIEGILKPMREKMEEMRKEVESSRERSVSSAATLETHIKEMMERAKSMEREADRLTTTLTRRVDIQGDWGETALRTILERSGITSYDYQYTIVGEDGRAVRDDESGQAKIPDVVVHFPDGKDVIIDSKVSLADFAAYQNATNEEEKRRALDAHIASMRRQVSLLAKKNYTASYVGKGRQCLDYVIMFVPVEGAMQLAVWNDKRLWQESFERGVFITSEQNLMLLLKLVVSAWTQENQRQNQEKVYASANNLLERMGAFVESLQGIEKGLDTARKSYHDAYAKLVDGKQSIKVSAKQLSDYGAKAKTGKNAAAIQSIISPQDEEADAEPAAIGTPAAETSIE